MSFLHISLLAGLSVIAVPLMLHLLGQRQPKIEVFPALRFVRQTVQAQRSSWQLRHLLLLLLRIGVVGALALAMARPRIHSAMLSATLTVSALALLAVFATLVAAIAWTARRPASVWATCALLAAILWSAAIIWGTISLTHGPIVPKADQSAPVAVALIIDTGPNMEYRADNKTRLEAAKEIAVWILDQLPIESRVGIFAGYPANGLSMDPASAKTQIQATLARGVSMDLAGQLASGIELLAANKLERKEAYIITDLSAKSWNSAHADLRNSLDEKSKDILVQVIDLGIPTTSNWSLGDLNLEPPVVPQNSSARIKFTVSRSASTAGGQATVRLYRENIDPSLPILSNGQLKVPEAKLVKEKAIDLSQEETVSLEFDTGLLTSGTHNFQVRIDRPDPLELDNVRYASILAHPQLPSLVVADADADENAPSMARYYALLIEASGSAGTSGEGAVQQISYDQIGSIPLDQYASICLIDPPPLIDATVKKIRERAEQGAGILIVLGRQLLAAPATAAIQELLPGRLAKPVSKPDGDRSLHIVPAALTHPIFSLLGANTAQLHWSLHPIFRYWTFESVADSVQILAKYSAGVAPAITQQKIGKGQVICFTTPMPDFDDTAGDNWNELTIGTDTWLAYALLAGTVRTLGSDSQSRYTFSVGESATFNNDPLAWPSQYELFTPAARSRRIDAENGALLLGELDQPGVFRLRGKRTGPISRSASVNLQSADTNLRRLETTQLDELLGAGNYRLARDRDELQSSVGQARFGQELYSMLMLLVAGLFLAEQAMSNRFYKLKFARVPGAA